MSSYEVEKIVEAYIDIAIEDLELQAQEHRFRDSEDTGYYSEELSGFDAESESLLYMLVEKFVNAVEKEIGMGVDELAYEFGHGIEKIGYDLYLDSVGHGAGFEDGHWENKEADYGKLLFKLQEDIFGYCEVYDNGDGTASLSR